MRARHQRIFGSALLALSLTLAAEPARAGSLTAERPALSRAFEWISLWWRSAVTEGRGLSHLFGKEGAGADPNGKAGTTTRPTKTSSGGSGSLFSLQGDQGLGSDPNGGH